MCLWQVESSRALVFNQWQEGSRMTTFVQQLLDSFDLLSEAEKRELALEILRRTVNFDLPPLSDEELVLSAEELFLELDSREAQDERP